MSEPIISKRCPKCKLPKLLSEFSKHRSTKDGLECWCKSCRKAYEQAYQQTEKGKAVNHKANAKYRQTSKGKAAQRKRTAKFNARNPNYRKAHHAVNHAIETGRLPRADTQLCHYCLNPAQQYHHWHGYEPKYWLDVVPACVECHSKEHRKTT